jgi:DNA polymerase-3 subunit delta'
MALDALEAQPRVAALLRRGLATGRLAHAYAFVGPAGSGRTAAALAFAQALLCPRGGCGHCRTCELAVSRQHPDLHVIVPTPPETNPKGARAIRIGAIRELERRASLKPAMAPRKVFIVDDAERMTGEAPEAFLKTLEEPPDRTVIVLVLDRPRAVPATVLSRCQLVRFQARPDERAAADRAEAEEMLAEVRTRGMDALFRRSQVFDRDRERAERFVDAYWLYCRDLLLAKAGADARLLGARADEVRRDAEHWSISDVLRAIETCREARRALAVNVTPRLTLEVLLNHLTLRVA